MARTLSAKRRTNAQDSERSIIDHVKHIVTPEAQLTRRSKSLYTRQEMRSRSAISSCVSAYLHRSPKKHLGQGLLCKRDVRAHPQNLHDSIVFDDKDPEPKSSPL